MSFLSKKSTAIFMFAVVSSTFEIMTTANSSSANSDADRDSKVFLHRGEIQTGQIISRLTCDQLLSRTDSKSRDFKKWEQIFKESITLTNENRKDISNAAQESLEAMRRYMNEYKKKGC
jgi:hypothetical protein